VFPEFNVLFFMNEPWFKFCPKLFNFVAVPIGLYYDFALHSEASNGLTACEPSDRQTADSCTDTLIGNKQETNCLYNFGFRR
jgi:hypothetical protein